MDLNEFNNEEIAGYDEVFKQLAERLTQYKENYPLSSNEADSLRQSFEDLQGFYKKGKKVWFDQHRLIFQNKIMTPGFDGVRNYIATDFYSLYTRLPLAEKLMAAISVIIDIVLVFIADMKLCRFS